MKLIGTQATILGNYEIWCFIDYVRLVDWGFY